MTLILAVVTGHYAIHASDRYTSIQPTPKYPSPDWDLHANKTVVAVGSDCWVVIGYSGLAYLDGRPTDRLIAEAITGYAELSDGAAFTGWFPAQRPHYREIRDRIENRIIDAYSRLPKATADTYATSVLIAGVQRKESMIYGVMSKVVVQGRTSNAKELAHDRLRWNQFHTHGIGSLTHNRAILADARRRIGGPGVASPEDIRDILINAVIESSKVDDGIGEDVMGVILDKRENKVDTYFKGADRKRQAELAAQVEPSEAFRERISVSTPYVITPGTIYGPSVSPAGGWVSSNGITFNFSGFDTDNGSEGSGGVYFGGHPRKPPPK